MSRRALAVAVLVCATLVSQTALAVVAIRTQAQPATGVHSHLLGVTLDVPVTLRTMSLSTGADTVLHVQRYPEGTFVAGNDDYPGLGVASQVTFTPKFTGLVWVVVRAYNDTTFGTGTLRTIVSNNTTDAAVSFGGRRIQLGASMTFGSLATVKEQGGATDTVLLVLKSTEHAVMYDDDDGFGAMSYVWMPGSDPCTGTGSCIAIVGTYNGGANTISNTTFIADERLSDSDGDSLGTALEVAMGTSDSDWDSDDDGLRDQDEVYGRGEWHGVSPNVDLPFYGANPTSKDIFFEADFWSQYGVRMTEGNAMAAAFRWLVAGITPHFDIGLANTNPSTWKTWGDWGGTNSVNAPNFPSIVECTGLTSSRLNIFHHMILTGDVGGGNAAPNGQPCYKGSQDYPMVLHETGHNVLTHSGVVPGNGGMDCNPLYNSVMNQRVPTDWYSNGSWGTTVVNPTSISERGWAGQPWLARAASFGFLVDFSNGYVDWNADNTFQVGPVRAAPTWVGGDCDPTTFAKNTWGNPAATPPVPYEPVMPSMTWVRDASTPTGLDRLVLMGKNPTSGNPRFATATRASLATCAQSPSRYVPCAQWTAFADVPGSVAAAGGPAVVGIGSNKFLLVYRDTQNTLRYQVANITPQTGGVSWTPLATIPDDTPWGDTDVAAVFDGSAAHVFVGYGGLLFDWMYYPGTMEWWGPYLQVWQGGAGVVTVTHGAGTTMGRQANDPASYMFMLVPDASGVLRFGRRTSANTWERYDQFWPAGQQTTTSSPALAFVDWRFYFGFTQLDWQGFHLVKMGRTEGNDAAPGANVQRLALIQQPILALNQWGAVPAGERTALAYDPGVDSNLRAAWYAAFLPLADGVVSTSLTDHDDTLNLRTYMDCGLYACCFGGTCPSWLQ